MKTEQEHNNEQCTMNNVQWKKVKLGEVGEIISGGTPSTTNETFWDGDVLFVTPLDLGRNNKIDSTLRTISELGVKNSSANKIKAHSLAISTRAPIGLMSIVNQDFTTNQGCKSIQFYDSYDSEFFYYYLSYNVEKIQRYGQGTTFMEISKTDFSNLEFTVPDLAAQRRIAAILASADKVIAATQKTIAKYKQIKQGMMEDLLKPKDGWKKVKLGEGIVKSICTGKLDANAMVEGGAYRFYTCAKDYTFIDNYAFDDEALLISGNGEYVGYVHYYKGKFNAYQRTYVLRDFSIDVNYLQCYLNMYLRDRIKKEMNAGSIPFIKMGTLTEMIICYPASPQEQKRMASILNGIDSKIEVEQRVLNKYIQVKKGLMEKLLEGNLE